VNIAFPELDSHDKFYTRPTTDDRRETAHTYSADNAYSSAVQRDSNIADCELTREEQENISQATTEAGEDSIVVTAVPDIELLFSDDEPTIEFASYY